MVLNLAILSIQNRMLVGEKLKPIPKTLLAMHLRGHNVQLTISISVISQQISQTTAEVISESSEAASSICRPMRLPLMIMVSITSVL